MTTGRGSNGDAELGTHNGLHKWLAQGTEKLRRSCQDCEGRGKGRAARVAIHRAQERRVIEKGSSILTGPPGPLAARNLGTNGMPGDREKPDWRRAC